MISIILLNYGSAFHTINCLKSLQIQTYKNFEIILIEQNSNEIYRKELLKFLNKDLSKNILEQTNFIQVKKNLGFTGGCNLGIRNSKGDIILLLNNDTFHDPDFLEKMVIFFEKNTFVHIAQPEICYYTNKNIIWQNGGIINQFSHQLFIPLFSNQKSMKGLKKPFKIDYAIGCALFIRRSVLKEIGLLDPIYFCYCEESDLCYRATLKGFKNIYCYPNTKIYHNCNPGLPEVFKKLYFRNRTIFSFKFFTIPVIIIQFLLQIVHLFILVTDLKKMKIDYKFLFRSIKGIIFGINLGIKKRIQFKKYRKKIF